MIINYILYIGLYIIYRHNIHTKMGYKKKNKLIWKYKMYIYICLHNMHIVYTHIIIWNI